MEEEPKKEMVVVGLEGGVGASEVGGDGVKEGGLEKKVLEGQR